MHTYVEQSDQLRLFKSYSWRLTCPECTSDPKTTPQAALSRLSFAFCDTMTGALPPSSRMHCFKFLPHSDAMILPTMSEPVKLTRRTSLRAIAWVVRAGACSLSIVTKAKARGGRPASSKRSTTMRWLAGEYSEALSKTVLPHMRGMPIARIERLTGAFHGAIAKTTCIRSSQQIPLPWVCRILTPAARLSTTNMFTSVLAAWC